jgi:hypothetical protein
VRGKGKNLIHIARLPRKMHREDRLDLIGVDTLTLWSRKEFLKRNDVKQQRLGLHVDKHRSRPAVLDDVGGGGEGDWRCDDDIPWPNPHRHQC